ncbi:MAG: PHP domain-containing protein, partial [Myxococcales bacterium]|nr:PHP domain-containing protein [Myxococcales bacterium]
SVFTWAPRPHRVDVRVVDGTGAPVSARVVVLQDGKGVDLGPEDGALADPELRDVPTTSIHALAGTGSVLLEPGTYRLLAVRSVRDGLGDATVVVDGPEEVTLTVPQQVDLLTHVASDLHVHSGRSYDAFLPHEVRVASLVAAGIQVAVLTDHNKVTELDGVLSDLMGPTQGGTRLLSGIEADVRKQGRLTGSRWDLGHVNAIPVVPAAVAPFPNLQPDSFGAYYDAFRARQVDHPAPGAGTDLLLQLNHPRGIHFRPEEDPIVSAWPAFRELGFDPGVPLGEGANAWLADQTSPLGTTPFDADALEVLNRFSLTLYEQVRRDWFALLDQGYRMTGTGNADSHALQVEIAGFPVTLVEAPAPVGDGPLDVPAWMAAVRGGRALVSTGPIPEIVVTGDGVEGRPGDVVPATGGAVV